LTFSSSRTPLSLASGLRRTLARYVAPPLQLGPTSLGFKLGWTGVRFRPRHLFELCRQCYRSFFEIAFFTLFFPQFCFSVALLFLCRLYSVFKVQCSGTLFAP